MISCRFHSDYWKEKIVFPIRSNTEQFIIFIQFSTNCLCIFTLDGSGNGAGTWSYIKQKHSHCSSTGTSKGNEKTTYDVPCGTGSSGRMGWQPIIYRSNFLYLSWSWCNVNISPYYNHPFWSHPGPVQCKYAIKSSEVHEGKGWPKQYFTDRISPMTLNFVAHCGN